MKKLTLTTAIAVILLLCLAAAAFANPAVTLLLNGEAVVTDVPPLLTGGRVMVPLRVIAEAFGAAVAWEEETNSVRVDMRETGTQPRQLQLLEEALAPQTPLAAAETWAEGVKMRNGALQYAMLDYELREEMRPGFAAMNWTTGTSSPWVKNYAVRETYRADNAIYRFAVEFVYTDSTEATFLTREYVTVNQVDGKWLITAIEKVDVAGEITTVTVGADNAVQSVFVEGDPASLGSYDKANVIIGSGTKIYEAYTDREMTAAALQEGTEVAVTFTDDPRIMIYPAVAEARTIRVLNDSPISGRIVYENNPYGFRFLLPEGWRGYSITQAEWEGAKEGKTVETGPVISLRHPEWTAEVPRQDIPVMIFTLTQWEAMAQAEFHIGAAPIGPSELGRNSKYVFALPARYNYAFPAGYEEVAEILASDPLQPLEPAGNEKRKRAGILC
ncbi:MAG: copper amine oxidase N-terminal domain-containing protein [bacterium]|jgi:hypothetical protein